MMVLRWQRSIQTPANALMIGCGNKPTMLAMVGAMAGSVWTVAHQMMEYCAALKLSREIPCPI